MYQNDAVASACARDDTMYCLLLLLLRKLFSFRLQSGFEEGISSGWIFKP